jgi:valyl-tRNA synthetase
VSDAAQSQPCKMAVEWFGDKFLEQLEVINDHYAKYRMSDALMATYKLIWDDFCAWYLEMIKPEFINGKAQPLDKTTYDATIGFFEQILVVLHPWMPFISEEIWHLVKDRSDKDCVIIAKWPESKKADAGVLTRYSAIMESIVAIRSIRNEKNISPKEPLDLYIKIPDNPVSRSFEPLMKKLCNLGSVYYTDKNVENATSFIVMGIEFFVPLSKYINADEERERLAKELEYNKGFLKSVQSKLANERFVQNAKPELVALEKKKQADAEAKIKALEEQLKAL